MVVFSLGATVDYSAVHKSIRLDKNLLKGGGQSFAFFMVLKKDPPGK